MAIFNGYFDITRGYILLGVTTRWMIQIAKQHKRYEVCGRRCSLFGPRKHQKEVSVQEESWQIFLATQISGILKYPRFDDAITSATTAVLALDSFQSVIFIFAGRRVETFKVGAIRVSDTQRDIHDSDLDGFGAGSESLWLISFRNWNSNSTGSEHMER